MDDIKKNLIESLKVALIYGKKNVDGANKDGIIEKIYKDEDDIAHYYYMREFLENHFKDETVVQKVIEKKDVNSIFFEIQKLGHIVFAENSSTPSYKTGLFYIPDSISDKQKKTLETFRKQLEVEDYNITELSNLYRSEDGILMGKQRMGKANILKDLTEIEQER